MRQTWKLMTLIVVLASACPGLFPTAEAQPASPPEDGRVRISESKITLTLPAVFPAAALFSPGKATLSPAGRELAQTLAPAVQALHEGVRVEMHVASGTSRRAALQLTKARAVAFINALVAAGVDASRLEAAGQGRDQPIASNSSESGRAQNERLQLVGTGTPVNTPSEPPVSAPKPIEPRTAPTPPTGQAAGPNERLQTILTDAADRLTALHNALKSTDDCGARVRKTLEWLKTDGPAMSKATNTSYAIIDHELNFQYQPGHMREFERYRRAGAYMGLLEDCGSHKDIGKLEKAFEGVSISDDLHYPPRSGPAAIPRCRRLRDIDSAMRIDPDRVKGRKLPGGTHALSVVVPGMGSCEYMGGVYCPLGEYSTRRELDAAFERELARVKECWPHAQDEPHRHSPVVVRQFVTARNAYAKTLNPVVRLSALPNGKGGHKLLFTISISRD